MLSKCVCIPVLGLLLILAGAYGVQDSVEEQNGEIAKPQSELCAIPSECYHCNRVNSFGAYNGESGSEEDDITRELCLESLYYECTTGYLQDEQPEKCAVIADTSYPESVFFQTFAWLAEYVSNKCYHSLKTEKPPQVDENCWACALDFDGPECLSYIKELCSAGYHHGYGVHGKYNYESNYLWHAFGAETWSLCHLALGKDPAALKILHKEINHQCRENWPLVCGEENVADEGGHYYAGHDEGFHAGHDEHGGAHASIHCKLYSTNTALYGHGAAVTGCTADIVAVCDQPLPHFDEQYIHAYGGGAYVASVDRAEYGTDPHYLIQIKMACGYKGNVVVAIDYPDTYTPQLVLEKLSCVPVKSIGFVVDSQYNDASHDEYYHDPKDTLYGNEHEDFERLELTDYHYAEGDDYYAHADHHEHAHEPESHEHHRIEYDPYQSHENNNRYQHAHGGNAAYQIWGGPTFHQDVTGDHENNHAPPKVYYGGHEHGYVYHSEPYGAHGGRDHFSAAADANYGYYRGPSGYSEQEDPYYADYHASRTVNGHNGPHGGHQNPHFHWGAHYEAGYSASPYP